MRRAAMAMARAQLQYEATLDDHAKSDFDAAAADFNAVFAASNLAQDVKDTLNLDVNNYRRRLQGGVRRRARLFPGDRRAGQGVRPARRADQGPRRRGRRGERRRRRARRRPRRHRDQIDLVAAIAHRHRPDFDRPRLPQPRQAARASSTTAMTRLAAGDLAVEPPALGRRGVYASIAHAFERIKQAHGRGRPAGARSDGATRRARGERDRPPRKRSRTRRGGARAGANRQPRWRKRASACPKAT